MKWRMNSQTQPNRRGEWGRAESRTGGLLCPPEQPEGKAGQKAKGEGVRSTRTPFFLYYLASQYPTTNSVHVQTTQASTIVSLDRLRRMEFTTL